MAEIWAVALTTAVTVGSTAYANSQAKKAQNKTQQAAADNVLPQFKLPDAPQFVPVNFSQLNNQAIQADTDAFRRSDDDFNRRNRPIALAEKIFQNSVLQDQKGDSTLTPQLQGEITRAGLAGAGAAFGDGGANLAPGSAQEAAVARNLGIGVMNFQDRNRQNREKSLSIAEQLFPRRDIGLGGEDAARVALSNNNQQNAALQQKYAADVGVAQKNYDINATNQNTQTTQANMAAKAEAERNIAMASAVAGAVNTGVNQYGQAQQSSVNALAANPLPTGTRRDPRATGILTGYTAQRKPVIA